MTHDSAALSAFCNHIVIMGYDNHYAGGPSGPVSPYDWIESNITHALDQGVPSSKVVMAVGGYGYDCRPATWPPTSIPSGRRSGPPYGSNPAVSPKFREIVHDHLPLWRDLSVFIESAAIVAKTPHRQTGFIYSFCRVAGRQKGVAPGSI